MFVISLLCDTFPISIPLFMAHIENTKLEYVRGFILIINPENRVMKIG